MITGVYGSTIIANLSLEEKRIDTAKVIAKIEYLCKFTNDMTKTVKYCYARKNVGLHKDRSVELKFLHNTSEDPFTYKVNFKPYGFWKYEIYEVSWIGTVTVSSGNAPATENDVLSPVADTKGVVQGLVTKGKMNLSEKDGTQQVQYKQREAPTETNYIYYGQ